MNDDQQNDPVHDAVFGPEPQAVGRTGIVGWRVAAAGCSLIAVFLPCLDTLRPLDILLSWRDGLQIFRIDVPGDSLFRAANRRSST